MALNLPEMNASVRSHLDTSLLLYDGRVGPFQGIGLESTTGASWRLLEPEA